MKRQSSNHEFKPRGISAAVALVLSTLLFLAAGCSSPAADESGKSATSDAAFPADIEVGDSTIHLEAQPTSIVVLGPSLTETVYAVGAADQVTAVDKLSNFPADAKVSDLDAFTPNAEAIAAMNPDLVLISNVDPVVEALEALDIPVAVLEAPTTLEEAYAQFETVGELTGHAEEGAELATSVQKSVDDAVSAVKGADAAKVYWELDPTGFSVTSDSFIGELLTKFGTTNIADAAPDAAGGYPQLATEYIVSANPDVVFLADSKCCQQDAAALKERPGFETVEAVSSGNVVPLDDDIASRWGPRIAELAVAIGDALQKLK